MNSLGGEQRALNLAEFEFSSGDFEFIANFAQSEFGISLPSSKHLMVYSRISRRMRSLGLVDFMSYKTLIESDETKTEKLELLSALTTNVTHFFRERHHFEFLKTNILPDLIFKAQNGGRIRIWSAGCSTGQEPYSIALSILELCPNAAELNIKILATDIDPKVVDQARSGRFEEHMVEKIPTKLRDSYFRNCDSRKESLEVTAELSALVSFGILNLTRSLPISGPLDVIFCRNVVIYFDKNTQKKVWEQIANVLARNGHLFIGHSETLSGKAASAFNSVDVTSYQKIA